MPRKKVTVRTDNSEWKAPKRRKPRKPMTEEQRVAAAERLAKAREKKAAADPNYGKTNIHESLRNLPDDHQLHPKRVKEWIKTQKDLASAERKNVKAGMKGAEARKSQMQQWQINSELQTKIHEITAKVTVNKAKMADKAMNAITQYISS